MAETDKYLLRNSHSISLNSHNFTIVETKHIHNASVLVNRGVSYPAIPPDTSVALVSETTTRRTIHDELLRQNHKVFARKESADSKFQLDQLRITKDYLGDMHKMKDPFDQRKFTYTRVPNPTRPDYNLPLKDFLQPHNPTITRSIGYSKGHVRSILHLDTFGPEDSKCRSVLIDSGELPLSPNIDRFAFDADHLAIQQQQLQPDDMTFGTKSSGMMLPSISKPLTKSSFSSSTKPKVGPGHTISAGTLGYYGQAIPESERYQYLSHSRSIEWFKSYQDHLQNKQKNQKKKKKDLQHMKDMRLEAKDIQSSIVDFEKKLNFAMMTV